MLTTLLSYGFSYASLQLQQPKFRQEKKLGTNHLCSETFHFDQGYQHLQKYREAIPVVSQAGCSRNLVQL